MFYSVIHQFHHKGKNVDRLSRGEDGEVGHEMADTEHQKRGLFGVIREHRRFTDVKVNLSHKCNRNHLVIKDSPSFLQA